MTLQQRINQLFDEHPDKKALHLAKYLGISRAAVSDWRNGNTKEMTGKNAFGTARFFGNINPEWVQSGEGRKYLKNDHIEGEVIMEGLPVEGQKLPIRSQIQLKNENEVMLKGTSLSMLGIFLSLFDTDQEYSDMVTFKISESEHPITSRCIAIEIDNEKFKSLGFYPGHYVLVDPSLTPKEGNTVLLWFPKDMRGTFATYKAVSGRDCAMLAEDGDNQTIDIPGMDAKIIGVAFTMTMKRKNLL